MANVSWRIGLCWLLTMVGGCSRTPLLSPDLDESACIELAPSGVQDLLVSTEMRINRSDVMFLVDNSGSMADEIEQIRVQLRDVLVPGIRARVPDAALGLATFSDFGERTLGERSHPYRLLQPITEDDGLVQEATRQIELEHGGDAVESHLEALYQVATGEGLGVFVDPGPRCLAGHRGGVCFRPGAFPLLLLFTDAPMRNVVGITGDGQPSATDDPFVEGEDAPFIPVVREYDQTLEALRAESIRVLGLWSGTAEGRDDLLRVTRDSGAVDVSGQPIVFDIGAEGQQLGVGVLDTIERMTAAAALDVELELRDVDADDSLDVRQLLTSITPLRAEPPDGAIVDREAGLFRSVAPGTELVFRVRFDTSALPDHPTDRHVGVSLAFVASDGTQLDAELLDLLIPAAGSSGCEAAGR